MQKPLFLLSNDDGIHAKGLHVLIDALRPMADLFVMAPDGPRSGAGCSITSAVPLVSRFVSRDAGLEIRTCSGTPVDCVKLALDQFLTERRPDIVIGGINHGNNASINAHYSGTMGVAFEGTLQGIPSIAYSLCDHSEDADFTPLIPYLTQIARLVLEQGLPAGTCLNVNFPLLPSYKGVRVCRMANSRWRKEYDSYDRQERMRYYWLTGECESLEAEANDTDSWALEHGYVAITPTRIDVTDYPLLNAMKAWPL